MSDLRHGTTLRCRVLGHKIKRNFHSAGYTTIYCSRCKRSETVRRYS